MPRKLLNPSLPSLHRKSACDLFTAEFEINDIRPAARTLLTKVSAEKILRKQSPLLEINLRLRFLQGQTQDEISQYAGASISTRGRFVSVAEKRSGVSNNDRPLYLFIQGNTKDSVDCKLFMAYSVVLLLTYLILPEPHSGRAEDRGAHSNGGPRRLSWPSPQIPLLHGTGDAPTAAPSNDNAAADCLRGNGHHEHHQLNVCGEDLHRPGPRAAVL